MGDGGGHQEWSGVWPERKEKDAFIDSYARTCTHACTERVKILVHGVS